MGLRPSLPIVQFFWLPLDKDQHVKRSRDPCKRTEGNRNSFQQQITRGRGPVDFQTVSIVMWYWPGFVRVKATIHPIKITEGTSQDNRRKGAWEGWSLCGTWEKQPSLRFQSKLRKEANHQTVTVPYIGSSRYTSYFICQGMWVHKIGRNLKIWRLAKPPRTAIPQELGQVG